MEKIFSRKNTVVTAGALGLSAILLSGCSSVEIKDDTPATVLQHDYDAPYTTWVWTGKVLVPIYHPEEYLLDIQQCGREDVKEADANGCVVVWEQVDKQTYDAYKDGQTIVFHSDNS